MYETPWLLHLESARLINRCDVPNVVIKFSQGERILAYQNCTWEKRFFKVFSLFDCYLYLTLNFMRNNFLDWINN